MLHIYSFHLPVLIACKFLPYSAVLCRTYEMNIHFCEIRRSLALYYILKFILSFRTFLFYSFSRTFKRCLTYLWEALSQIIIENWYKTLFMQHFQLFDYDRVNATTNCHLFSRCRHLHNRHVKTLINSRRFSVTEFNI